MWKFHGKAAADNLDLKGTIDLGMGISMRREKEETEDCFNESQKNILDRFLDNEVQDLLPDLNRTMKDPKYKQAVFATATPKVTRRSLAMMIHYEHRVGVHRREPSHWTTWGKHKRCDDSANRFKSKFRNRFTSNIHQQWPE